MSGLTVGSTGPIFKVGPLTRTHFVRYAGAANDFNPLHHDDEYARAAGHRSVFAHGMFSAGLLASYLAQWFGADCVKLFSVRFRDQVWPGEMVAAEGRVSEINDDNQTATVLLSLTREGGEVVVSGKATVWILQSRPEG